MMQRSTISLKFFKIPSTPRFPLWFSGLISFPLFLFDLTKPLYVESIGLMGRCNALNQNISSVVSKEAFNKMSTIFHVASIRLCQAKKSTRDSLNQARYFLYIFLSLHFKCIWNISITLSLTSSLKG